MPPSERHDSGNGIPAEPKPAANATKDLPAPPAVISSAPNFFKLLQALRRRWRLALGLGLAPALAAAAAVWFFLPPGAATARTLVRVASTQPKIMFETAEARSDFSNYQRAQIALIKSRLVLNTALRKREVAELSMVQEQIDPVEWLEKNIQADYTIAPEILRISISGNRPQELVTLVDAVRDAYLDEIVNKEQHQKLKRLDHLRKLYAEYDDDLRNKRRTLRKMAGELGSRDSAVLAEKQKFAQAQLNTLQTEMLQLQSQLRKAKLEVLASQAREKGLAKTNIPEGIIDDLITKDPVVVGYTREIKQLEADIDYFKNRSVKAETEPAYKRFLAALDSAKKALAARRDQLRPDFMQQLRDKIRADAKTNHALEQDRAVIVHELEKVLAEEIQRRLQDIDQFKTRTIDLVWLNDEIAQIDDVAKKVGSQVQALQVEIQAPSRVELLEKAIMSSPDNAKQRVLLTGLAGLGVLVLVFAGVALLEFRARRVTSADEVVNGLGIKLVGSLPFLPQRAQRLGGAKNARDLYWHNLLTESVDAIRTNLLHTARRDSLRIVMVTSALGGEGKTMLSCHLAASLARAGCKTLLVDGDLRRPAVHKLFNLPLGPGLNELLRDEADIAEVVRDGPVPGLSLLPAGTCDGRSLQALAQERMAAIYAGLKESYDLIVVDSPPVLPVADSLLIGQHADGVVFTVLRDVSSLPTIYAAYERLMTLNIRILGAVVNGGASGFYGTSYRYNTVPAAATVS